MKSVNLFIIILFFGCFSSTYGQKNSYSSLKKTYSEHDFKGLEGKPKYSPFIAGAGGVLFSGVGHYYLDEPKRGAKYFTAELIADGLALASAIPTFMVLAFQYNPENPVMVLVTMGSIFYFVSAPYIVAIIKTLSIIDAVKIAKVKSVAYADVNDKTLSLKLLPELKYQNFGMNSNSLVCGLNLRLSF